MSYTSSVARDVKTLEPLWSLLKKTSFQRRIRVDTDFQSSTLADVMPNFALEMIKGLPDESQYPGLTSIK